MEDLTKPEINYLYRAILYLKFRCKDDDDKPSELAGSSFANSILDKLYDEYREYHRKHFDVPKHWPFEDVYMPTVELWIKNVGKRNWDQHSVGARKEIIKSRLYPLMYSEDLIDKILTMIDSLPEQSFS